MTGDAFLIEPGGGVGRAMQASAQGAILDQMFDSGTLYALRATVQAHLGRFGLSDDRTDEVVLAVHELAANAISHGAGAGRLRIWEQPGALRCQVEDGDPPDAADLAAPWPSEPGHGLWVVRQAADQMQVQAGPRGTRAVAIFDLPAGWA
jgi:anti-sigma regulatory factor (Ser/Thr protein kinase)